jgi:erythromycin esterase
MQQWLITQVAHLRPTGWDRSGARANYMGQNLRALIEAADPDAKIITWAYNSHLHSVTQEDEGPNMGSIMRETFGDRYYAIGFEFNQGSFQNRILLPSNYFGDLLTITLPPSPPHTLGWYLAQVGQSLFFLELRSAGNPLVTAWLDQVQEMHSGGWVVNLEDEERLQREVLQGYDAFIFVESTTPSRPTPNARRRVANREGL